MSFTDPPIFITQLKTQLIATAAWVAAGGVAADIHYPEADKSTGFPCFILAEENVSYTKFAYGIEPIPSGDLEIYVSDITSVGKVEQLARDIGKQICVDLGLANLSVTGITPSNTPTAKERADGTVIIFECSISLTFGLNPP